MKSLFLTFLLMAGFAIQNSNAQVSCSPCPPECCVIKDCKPENCKDNPGCKAICKDAAGTAHKASQTSNMSCQGKSATNASLASLLNLQTTGQKSAGCKPASVVSAKSEQAEPVLVALKEN